MSSIGKLITEGGAKRDALHFAVAPVTAAHHLKPGDRVMLKVDGTATHASSRELTIGIVDPFLDQMVMGGDRFWLFLLPDTITSLRHAWTHPSFKDEELGDIAPQNPVKATASRQWLEDFADGINQPYEAMIAAADRYVASGGWDYTYDNSESYKGSDWSDFWKHWAEVTGKEAPEDAWAPYTCSC